MTVSDVDNDPTYCSFFISHPVKVTYPNLMYFMLNIFELMYVYMCVWKSFVVVAESPVSKQQWLRDIRQTIESCKKRELNRTTVLNR
jgi:hypothetical protein